MACKHLNYAPAGYKDSNDNIRLQSAYDVYCLDCKNYINLMTRENLNHLGLLIKGEGEVVMGTRTEAGDCIDSAKSNINAAISQLSDVVINRVNGAEEYKKEYLSQLNKALFDLIQIRELID